jgi:hypothetical protein
MQAYSDLKAMELYTASFGELSSTENKVAFSCQTFNDAVTSYNTYKKQTFLSFFLTASFGHSKDASLLEFADSARDKPRLLLGFSKGIHNCVGIGAPYKINAPPKTLKWLPATYCLQP